MTATPAGSPTHSSVRLAVATRATYAVFIAAGFALASWASRIPQVRERLSLTPAQLGFLLLALAAGSLIALPLAGTLVHRITARRTVAVMAAVAGVGLLVVAVGYFAGAAAVALGLFLFGFGSGAWDVAMNVQGASVERQIGRAIMPRFHAGFSAGTVVGALIGAAMIALNVPVTAHLLVVAVIVVLAVPLAARGFVPDDPTEDSGERTHSDVRKRTNALLRWREPRTLLIGLVVLAFALTEGSAIDWVSVALIDDHHVSAVTGTLGFAAFLTAMTAVRWFGNGLLDRYGRVPVLRGLAAVAITGLALFIFSPFVPLALVGVILWGAGASLGFPVGMSAAAGEPAAAAGRLSVVASIGYCAFLGGPPLIGVLGNQFSVLRALIVVAVLLALATAVTPALRPLPTSR